MPKNLKKLVRERRAKTGESHQTALRHVRNQRSPTGFEALVLHIIRLAKARNWEHDADARNHGAHSVRELLDRLLQPLPPCNAALRRALSDLSYADLRKVEVLMYSGRDGDDVHEVECTLHRDEHPVTVGVIASKIPLDEYLQAGLARAKRDGVDLDHVF